MTVAELVKKPDDTECTADPFWFIAINGTRGMTILKGIWFSRAKAEEHLRLFSHRYPKTAFVYCASGTYSDIERLRYLASKEECIDDEA